MSSGGKEHEDREQERERFNTLRVVGGLLLLVALLLLFFHLAEVPMGRYAMGVLAGLLGISGAALLWVGWRGIQKLR